MEPLNTLPCVQLPHEVLNRWLDLADARVFRALVMFASSQLKFGPSGFHTEKVRMHCRASPELWEQIKAAVTSELEQDEEGRYRFRFVEKSRDAATLRRLTGVLTGWLGRHPGWGGTTLPPLVRGLLKEVPEIARDRMETELLAVQMRVKGVVRERDFPQVEGQGTLRVPGRVPSPAEAGNGRSGGPGAGYPEALNKTKAQAPAGASVTRVSQAGGHQRSALAPPSDSRVPSHRRGSTMFPLRKNPQGGPGGVVQMGSVTKVLPSSDRQCSKRESEQPRAAAKRAAGRRA